MPLIGVEILDALTLAMCAGPPPAKTNGKNDEVKAFVSAIAFAFANSYLNGFNRGTLTVDAGFLLIVGSMLVFVLLAWLGFIDLDRWTL
jgi:hypothetical protein